MLNKTAKIVNGQYITSNINFYFSLDRFIMGRLLQLWYVSMVYLNQGDWLCGETGYIHSAEGVMRPHHSVISRRLQLCHRLLTTGLCQDIVNTNRHYMTLLSEIGEIGARQEI